MAAGLNIAALAHRTGVRPDTLRKWEQRYGVLRPERTAGGQRRYGERDVARVEWLKARLADGYRIGEAAALLGATDDGPAARTPAELRERLYDSVRESDAASLLRLVEQALALLPLEGALDEVIVPLLERIGEGWSCGQLSVAQEHMATAAVRAHLERLVADPRAGVRGVAVLACAPGERHELGLLMLAVLLRADGWQVAYLGADTPVEDATALAEALSARLVCFSATMPAAAERLSEVAATDRARVLVGGAAIEGSERDLGALVRRLRGRAPSGSPS